jgi:hypothetical protein
MVVGRWSLADFDYVYQLALVGTPSPHPAYWNHRVTG